MRNILFCGNSKVFDGVLTCMLSVLKRTHATDPFCFYRYFILNGLIILIHVTSSKFAYFIGQILLNLV